MRILKIPSILIIAIILLADLSFVCGQTFPQQAINKALLNNNAGGAIAGIPHDGVMEPGFSTGVFALMKQLPAQAARVKSRISNGGIFPATDTIFVGVVPNDTLIITGNFFNNGPVLVFNDGVLIFENADATILGDIYVFQNGKLFADSSVINCPQQYFYQRSMIIANSGYVNISNSTLDFGGLSHSLAVVDNGVIEMSEINNIGFTTAGAYGNATISIDGTNQAGEFIMTDSASLSFTNANTVLLWHHTGDGSIVDISFPSGATVPSYIFNDGQPGVDGVGYDVAVTNCTDVMWALMPENGSDVTITGSTLRAIGLWFTGSDTTAVSGLVNNSNYTTFTAPLSDRNLQLNTTSVQTWSIYIFGEEVLNITGCIVGEVGSMGTSFVTAQGILCDGSGGYYWASDTSLNIAVNTTILGYIRSQGNGIVLLGYGSSTAGASATGNSVMVVTQSSLPQDPVAYEKGTTWRVHIDPPQNLYVDTFVIITGSAWVDQGPLGSFMDFGFYTVEYRPASGTVWLPVSAADSNEVHSNFLAQWNTNGLVPGNYQLRLNTQNNLGDSIDAVIQVTLLPSILGIQTAEPDIPQLNLYYNEAEQAINGTINFQRNVNSDLTVTDMNGKTMYYQVLGLQQGNNAFSIPVKGLRAGMYFVKILSPDFNIADRILIY